MHWNINLLSYIPIECIGLVRYVPNANNTARKTASPAYKLAANESES